MKLFFICYFILVMMCYLFISFATGKWNPTTFHPVLWTFVCLMCALGANFIGWLIHRD